MLKVPAPYSVDLRERVLQLHATGKYSRQQVANIFNVSLSTVKLYLRLERAGKALEPGRSTGRIPKLNADELDFIKQLVKEHPDASLEWFRDQIKKQTKKKIAISTTCRILIKLGFTRKKKSLRERAG